MQTLCRRQFLKEQDTNHKRDHDWQAIADLISGFYKYDSKADGHAHDATQE